ncbi:MAG: hypothetical protein BJ554DRAFT_2405 [Olpidium bornovanus]|uniref:Uncharacterized protein n=1 Tax=Olpidium bornovanus TaxID=278681 RepID=A0A8H7ZQV5_9FUNG|nr:MAG: hypothetical protein BJ554DRAFT_2405 [Olpidium bornovanus]
MPLDCPDDPFLAAASSSNFGTSSHPLGGIHQPQPTGVADLGHALQGMGSGVLAAKADIAPALKFVLGLATSLFSSALYAAGLNLIQRDAVNNAQRAPRLRRSAWQRPWWILGMAMFVGSQIVGQTIVICECGRFREVAAWVHAPSAAGLSGRSRVPTARFAAARSGGFKLAARADRLLLLPFSPFALPDILPPLFVAPLGAMTLIFNFLIARFLVGTRITRKDTLGTVIVICSVVCIVLLANLKDDDRDIGTPTLCYLQHLYSRPIFVFYFLIVDSVTVFSLFVAFHSKRTLSNELRHRNSRIWKGINRRRMSKGVGVCFASVGGLLASQTLLLGKSGVLILLNTANGDNQFTQGTLLPHAIVFFLGVTAVLQVVCLNNALQFVDSVVVVPIFYGFYTALGLVNTMVYLDEFDQYRLWVLLLLVVGMLLLCYGVRLLSMKKPPAPPALPSDVSDTASSAATVVDDGDVVFAEGQDVVAFDFVTPDDVGGVIEDEDEWDAARSQEPPGTPRAARAGDRGPPATAGSCAAAHGSGTDGPGCGDRQHGGAVFARVPEGKGAPRADDGPHPSAIALTAVPQCAPAESDVADADDGEANNVSVPFLARPQTAPHAGTGAATRPASTGPQQYGSAPGAERGKVYGPVPAAAGKDMSVRSTEEIL